MIALSTSVEPHSGQATKPRLRCFSYAALSGNQLSNACPSAQPSAYLIIVQPARSASSLPVDSSACKSSQPPTCVSPMKICGTVQRPRAFSAIAACAARSPSTPISSNGAALLRNSALAAWQKGQVDLVQMTIGATLERSLTRQSAHFPLLYV